jgi:hypothetical protein
LDLPVDDVVDDDEDEHKLVHKFDTEVNEDDDDMLCHPTMHILTHRLDPNFISI